MLFAAVVFFFVSIMVALYRECKRVKREEDFQKAKDLVDVATRRNAYISNKNTNWSE